MISIARMMMIIFGLAICIRFGSALYCWECSSNRDPWCDDPINITEHRRTFNPTPCGYKNQYPNYGNDRYVCRKMVKRDNGRRSIIRQCSTVYHDEMDVYDGPCGALAMQTSSHDSIVESCHICSTDNCNSATSVSMKQWLYAGALMFFVYTFYQSKYVHAL